MPDGSRMQSSVPKKKWLQGGVGGGVGGGPGLCVVEGVGFLRGRMKGGVGRFKAEGRTAGCRVRLRRVLVGLASWP